MENQINHYVPKFYLRLFSNSKKSIRKYMFDNDKIINHSSIEVTGGSYGLYGDNSNGIEKQFMTWENNWSVVIKNVIEKEAINSKERDALLSFLVYSDNRTLKQADIQNEIVTKRAQADIRIRRDKGEIDISDEEIESIKFTYDIPISHPYNVSPELIDCCKDLSIGLIKNTSGIDFITSDNPVAKYNYLYVKKGYFRPFGYCHRGVIFFLPLSPKICLIVYDNEPYDSTGVGDGVFTIEDNQEILKLNRLFVNVAYKEIYIPNSFDDKTIEIIKGYRVSREYNPITVWHGRGSQLQIRQAETFFDDLDFAFITPKEEYIVMDYPTDMRGLMRPTAIY